MWSRWWLWCSDEVSRGQRAAAEGGRCTSRGCCRRSRPTQVALCTQQKGQKDRTNDRHRSVRSTVDRGRSTLTHERARSRALHADATHTPVRLTDNKQRNAAVPATEDSVIAHPRPSPSTHSSRTVAKQRQGCSISGGWGQRTKWAIDYVRRVNKADQVQQQPTHLGRDGESATHRTTAPCTSRRPRKIARPPQ